MKSNISNHNELNSMIIRMHFYDVVKDLLVECVISLPFLVFVIFIIIYHLGEFLNKNYLDVIGINKIRNM